jgi:hypothetical protein
MGKLNTVLEQPAERVCFAGVRVGGDMTRLVNSRENNCTTVDSMAKLRNVEAPKWSMEALVLKLLGMTVDKALQKEAPWLDKQLAPVLLQYAALDGAVAVCRTGCCTVSPSQRSVDDYAGLV